jgi:hypothetical protein
VVLELGLGLTGSGAAEEPWHGACVEQLFRLLDERGLGLLRRLVPAIWQYSDAVPLHSASVDFNVFLGSGTTDTATLVEEFKSVVTTGKLPEHLARRGHNRRQIARAVRGRELDGRVGHAQGDRLPLRVLRPGHKGPSGQCLNGTPAATSSVPTGAELWVLSPPS